jgi:glycosidase
MKISLRPHSLSFISSLFLLILFSGSLVAQTRPVNEFRVEPPFWWAGMQCSKLQLLVHAKDVSGLKAVVNYPGITIQDQVSVENPNYLFINLLLDKDLKPGSFDLQFMAKGKVVRSYRYEMKQRLAGSASRKGFTPSDVIYLLMPDRFANGNPANDSMPGMLEKPDRSKPLGRHGGDLAGIRKHLGYISDLGFTALWPNPVLENNNAAQSYHGYAITDFYKVDPRLGTNEEYLELIADAHAKGLKVIMDMVFNHCGINHWFINDLPVKNWIHQFPQYTRSNFRAESVTDLYAAEVDRNRMLQGWFDRNMPDLDQRNPFLREYLIQNSIWWIEYSGIDGIRLDTQPYPYKEMMAEWTKRVNAEYPDFTIVGEAWLQKESMTSYYQKDTELGDGYNSGLHSVTDFPLYNATTRAFTENEGWTEGMARLYYVLAQDFLYANPSYLLTFLDNHDLNRYYNTIGNDLKAMKMALTFLLTTRGIPQIYYGTELLMDGQEHVNHGEIRKDFPGGWPGDSINAFTPQGRTNEQNEVFNHLQRLLQWRKDNEVISQGSLKHFVPEDGVYVYFRTKGDQKVMVIINRNPEQKVLKTSRYEECINGYATAFEVLTGRLVSLSGEVVLPARTALVYELKK